jgi:hypothetical protein
VERFITLKPHARSGYQSIPDFVRMRKESQSTELISPLQLADLIESDVNDALGQVGKFGPVKDPELRQTLDDIRTVCHLGRYYAEKIRGATHLALCRDTEDPNQRKASVASLTRASEHWKAFADLATSNYHNPLWMNRVGILDWNKLRQDVETDIEIARTE